MRIDFSRKQNKNSLILGIVIIVIFGVLGIISPDFLTYGFFNELLKRVSEVIVLTIAVTIVFISGGFDLSFGSVMALSGVVCGTLYNTGFPFSIAILCGVSAGMVVGAVNATIVVKLRLDPFIVTLAMLQIIRSVVYGISAGKTVVGFPRWFEKVSDISILKVPLLFIIMILIAILGSFLLRKTIIGRYIYAMGGNEIAANISGIYVNRIKYFVYILSGFLSSISGLMLASRVNSAPPNVGLYIPLEVVTAVVVGGTLITGGEGSILGSFFGIFAMVLLLNGFNILGINPFWNLIVLGMIMVFIVGYERIVSIFSPLFSKKSRQSIKYIS